MCCHFTEALAYELKETGLVISTLCPGPTKSEFQEVSGMTENVVTTGPQVPTSAAVAEYGYRALMGGKVVAIHGITNQFLVALQRLLPKNIIREITGRMLLDRAK